MIVNIRILYTYFNISLTIILLQACNRPDNEIVQAVRNQLHQYPESTLVDIYKSFLQDEFGPGHLLNDTTGAREYLEYELSEMTSNGNHEAEPCGSGKNFYRVPLDLVQDGKIPLEIYLAAFMESAASFRIPETGKWKLKWPQIVREIESMDLEINDFEKDKLALTEMLEKGETVVHHSKIFIERYNPHYRIMRKEQWEALQHQP